MANRMLIDASHPEETRVVVQRNNRIEEFDFESASRKQLRGNIYLAKVIRVEPSLQAAFVEYGGNRHGFLAFSEIHPDYYQIPVADRMALLEEEARVAAREDSDEENRRGSKGNRRKPRNGARAKTAATDGESVSEAGDETGDGDAADEARNGDETDAGEHTGEAAGSDEGEEAERGDEERSDEGEGRRRNRGRKRGSDSDADDAADEGDVVEQVGAGDALDEISDRPARVRRHHYKIQEVIKRRQVLLVQVVKEERGTKGAALTTYLSLAGRYSVLMPNTARGGGISRKITDSADRKRLKSIAEELEVPEGMGVILRTAGAARTKLEVKRDFEYLLRVWETVRELTLKSVAPQLTYEEGSLIKRAIRDLYSKDVEEIYVAGDEGYREAKEFMKMLMPSNAKVVKPYKDPQPIFARFGVEAQLDAMFSSTVTLKSGGYIVINPTEALVSIDVNSGRSTREHNIEDTALKTNLEAAEEVARQLRLRDLAGLIVIDFIDMEEKRNNRAVERKLKECLKNDRARIQVGRISHFGLMEMSRQRIRTGVLESSTSPCPHCGGTGFVRATPSVALHIIRGIEEALLKNSAYNLTVYTRTEVTLYVLNQKRLHLRDLEKRFGVVLTVLVDDTLVGSQYFTLERGDPAPGGGIRPEFSDLSTSRDLVAEAVDDEVEAEVEDEADEESEASGREESDGENGDIPGESEGDRQRRRRRRRRRRGRGGDRDGEARGEFRAAARERDGDDVVRAEGDAGLADDAAPDDADDRDEGDAGRAGGDDEQNGERRRRRRGRRGGRRMRREDGSYATADESTGGEAEAPEGDADEAVDPPVMAEAAPAEAPVAETPEPAEAVEAAPKRRRRTRKSEAATVDAAEAPAEVIASAEKPARRPRRGSAAARALEAAEAAAAASAEVAEVADVVAEATADVPAAAAPAPAPAPAPVEVPAPAAVAPAPAEATGLALPPEQVAPPVPVIEVEGGSNGGGSRKSGWWSKARKVLGG